MTENLDPRLAALQARRGQPKRSPRPSRPTSTADHEGNGGSTPDPQPPATTRPTKKARKHAAPASRILALGLSASAMIALTGIMIRPSATTAAAADPGTTTTTEPAPIVVHVVLPNGQIVQGTQTPTAAVATPSAQPAARPTTTPTVATRSRAS